MTAFEPILSDDEVIAQRLARDAYNNFVSALNPEIAPRLAPMLAAMHAVLDDGRWHGYKAVLAAMLRASDCAHKTADIFVRDAVKIGVIERRGEYHRGKYARDGRELRLLAWPVTE